MGCGTVLPCCSSINVPQGTWSLSQGPSAPARYERWARSRIAQDVPSFSTNCPPFQEGAERKMVTPFSGLVAKASCVRALVSALLVATALAMVRCGDGGDPPVTEFALAYPSQSTVPAEQRGSTHEITFDRHGGQV